MNATSTSRSSRSCDRFKAAALECRILICRHVMLVEEGSEIMMVIFLAAGAVPYFFKWGPL